jgi:hypothetical protein
LIAGGKIEAGARTQRKISEAGCIIMQRLKTNSHIAAAAGVVIKRPLTIGCVAEATAGSAKVLVKGLITDGRVSALQAVTKQSLITDGRVTGAVIAKERAITDRGIASASSVFFERLSGQGGIPNSGGSAEESVRSLGGVSPRIPSVRRSASCTRFG